MDGVVFFINNLYSLYHPHLTYMLLYFNDCSKGNLKTSPH
jgi:hypothetical protein